MPQDDGSRRAVGGSDGLAGPEDRTSSVLRLLGSHGFASWLYQEVPENAQVRSRFGNEKNEELDMTEDIEKGRLGQYFEEFLKEQGTYESTTAQAVKRVLAFQLSEAMKTQGLSKVEMARRLHTSRSQLDRLLDPENEGVTVGMLARAAKAVGRELRIELA